MTGDPRRELPRKLDPEEARQRLSLYTRYAGLVDAQVRALDSEDMDRFQDLAEARDEIQEALMEDDRPLPSAESLDSEGRKLLESARQGLRTALVRDEELRRRLTGLREETRKQLHTISRREGGVRRYVVDEEPSPEEGGRRVNVRL